MDLALESTPKSQAKFHSKFLLTCSIVNILIFPLCVGLEIGNPLAGQGVWGSITFILTGILGFSTSYNPKKQLIISTVVFSVFSICFAIISASITLGGGLRQCSYFEHRSDCSEGFRQCNTNFHSHSVCYYRVNPIMLTIANTISLVNNIIVTVLLSKITCKCCAGSVVSTSVPIVPVHNPPVNPQQLTPTTVSPSGQQQQIQSYPIVVYSTFQQEPIPTMPGHQQGNQWPDHPSAPTKTLPRDITDPVANLIINSPPPYSTLTNGAAMEPHPKKESYKS